MTERRWDAPWPHAHARRGVTLIEVVVVVVIIGLAFLIMLLMLPQGREQARLVGCRNNLAQIGKALAIYDQLHGRLPEVGMVTGPDASGAARWPGPLRALLETLQLPDLTEVQDSKSVPKPRPGQVPGEMPVPGFVCASDPNATAGLFTAPISYRATTGATTAGDDGAFAIGHVLRLQDVEAADGLSYTAAFSERLVGDHQPGHRAPGNYQVVAGPLTGSGCPATDDGPAWRGDAGSSWNWADFRSTLYNHSQRPGALTSCLAVDGKTAFMTASSGHVRGLNLLRLDGSVNLVTRDINLKVWQELARINLR